MQISTAQRAFDKFVGLKYELYNGLFLTLPFQSLEEEGIKLPIFGEHCRRSLREGLAPKQIIEHFFRDILRTNNFEKQMKVLFLFAQLVERQVVLFDALEEAAFSQIHSHETEGSLEYFLQRAAAGKPLKKLTSSLKEYRTRVVLTAHPTQFYPELILGIISELGVAIADDDLLAIEQILLQLGKTSFRNLTTPTPLSEADNLLDRVRDIFYEAILDVENRLQTALEGTHPQKPLIELGFWPGGDRDGNPFVDVATTLQVARELRRCAFSHYETELKTLKRRLTFPGMPEALQVIEERLKRYQNPEELGADLDRLRETLLKRHQGLFVEHLDRFRLAVRTFGFHFASLDLRQDSSIHESVVAGLLAKLGSDLAWPKECGRYQKLTSEQKTRLLEELFSHRRPNRKSVSLKRLAIAEDVLGSLKAVKDIQKKNGEAGLHRYIISNSQRAQHVLEILFLGRLLGYQELPLDIVPLFETVEDLKSAGKVMGRLFDSEVYRQHLTQRGGTQIVMVGFSDGTKDGGYLTCNWEILRAKQRLEKLSRERGVKIVFFDGRGGPPARGGGNTHRFYRAVGANLVKNGVQVTVQGQTISSKFGTYEAARLNLEQLFTAGLEAQLFSEPGEDLGPEDVEIVAKLSQRSHDAYMELRGHEAFLEFLQTMTPLPYFGALNVASRPAKRRQSDKLRLQDLRAIPFVGAWSQIKLNVPGFYGLGISLEWAFENGMGPAVRRLYREKLFFRTLLDNAMQALIKSDPTLTQHLLEHSTFGPFVKNLHEETERTRQYLLKVSGQKKLLEMDPINRKSIELRESLIRPLLVIQNYAMWQLRTCENEERRQVYEKLLLKTLPPVINASRNSA